MTDSSELKSEFIAALQEHLDQLHEPLVKELALIRTVAIPEQAEQLIFTYFCDSFDSEAMPVFVAAATASSGWEYVESYENHWLRLLEDYRAPNLPEDWGFADSNVFDPYSTAIELTGREFRKAWLASGGLECPLPCYFTEHDDNEHLNLTTGLWENK